VVEAGDALPSDWRSSPAMPEVQQLGDDWVESNTSAVLRVPSAIVPSESNFLLNPDHLHFGEIGIGQEQPVEFDPRLK
jgi:RES domain-containing protein